MSTRGRTSTRIGNTTRGKCDAKANTQRTERTARAAGLVGASGEAMAGLIDERSWARLLRGAARGLWRYSPRNQLLILAQTEDRGFEASAAAGYKTWQSLGRQVRRGERGLQILAPAGQRLVRIDADEELAEDEVVTAEDGTRLRAAGQRWAAIHVWDITQTDPLDDDAALSATPADLLGVVGGLRSRLIEQIEAHGYTIVYQPISGAVHGYTDPTARRVVIDTSRDEVAQTKTLAHELAHIALGHDEPSYAYHEQRAAAEIAAECLAYVVVGAFGLDQAESIGYVASWAAGHTDAIRDVLSAYAPAAREVLTGLTGADAHA